MRTNARGEFGVFSYSVRPDKHSNATLGDGALPGWYARRPTRHRGPIVCVFLSIVYIFLSVLRMPR